MDKIFDKDCRWSWVENYSDVSPCIELICVHDDVLKKDMTFIRYAIMLAQQIVDDKDNKIKCKITYGKWGARLETDKNEKLSRKELEQVAEYITNHPCWRALKRSTFIFTYGDFEE